MPLNKQTKPSSGTIFIFLFYFFISLKKADTIFTFFKIYFKCLF